MGYNDIFYENEAKYHEYNNNYFKKFIFIFQQETGIDINKKAEYNGIKQDDYITKFYYLKHIIFIYFPNYIKYFYELLEISGFDMSSEIIDFMKLIGQNTINILDEDIKNYILISPQIDAIEIN